MRPINEASLTERDFKAVTAAVEMLTERFPVERVIVFGSKARGDFDEDSDIDLLLVTSRPVPWRERRAMIDALFDIEMAHGTIISIMLVTLEDWSSGIFTEFPIYREIMRDGVLAA